MKATTTVGECTIWANEVEITAGMRHIGMVATPTTTEGTSSITSKMVIKGMINIHTGIMDTTPKMAGRATKTITMPAAAAKLRLPLRFSETFAITSTTTTRVDRMEAVVVAAAIITKATIPTSSTTPEAARRASPRKSGITGRNEDTTLHGKHLGMTIIGISRSRPTSNTTDKDSGQNRAISARRLRKTIHGTGRHGRTNTPSPGAAITTKMRTTRRIIKEDRTQVVSSGLKADRTRAMMSSGGTTRTIRITMKNLTSKKTNIIQRSTDKNRLKMQKMQRFLTQRKRRQALMLTIGSSIKSTTSQEELSAGQVVILRPQHSAKSSQICTLC